MMTEGTSMIQLESWKSRTKLIKIVIILLNVMLLATGGICGPMFVRMYYLHGGNRRWLTAGLLTGGFPILLIPILIQPLFAKPSPSGARPNFILLPSKLISSACGIGLVLGLCSYLYAFGVNYLPLSVTAVIGSTNLAFTAVAAYFVVKQRFTAYSINSVVMMILGSIIIGIHVQGEKPVATSASNYVLGVLLSLFAAAIHGFLNSFMEYASTKSGVVMSFGVLMQLQFVILLFATIFCLVPILVNGDFQAMPKEAAEFGLGKHKYYAIILLAALGLQLYVVGGLGLLFMTSSLFAGIVGALIVPFQQLFAVILLNETYSADKGISLAVCLWGFASYFYGEYKSGEKSSDDKQDQLEQKPTEKEIAV